LIEHKKFTLIFSTILSEIYLFLKTKKRDTVKNVHVSSCKAAVILVQIQSDFSFHERFSKNTQLSNFIKIRPVGRALFHVDEQRLEGANSCFLQFCECALKRPFTTYQLCFVINGAQPFTCCVVLQVASQTVVLRNANS
jgi:hypothetical protein